MKPTVSPYFSRTISALVLWVSLSALFSVNVFGRFNGSSYWETHRDVLTYPTSAESHVILARSAWSKGNESLAKNELLVAQAILARSGGREKNVLGVTTSPLDLLRQWEEEPKRLEQEMKFWQSVVGEKKDYRDGYLAVSASAYRLNKIEEAQKSLDAAQTLDPNFPFVRKLSDLIAQAQ